MFAARSDGNRLSSVLCHPSSDYTDAIKALLPPGKAWEWKAGGAGLGHAMLSGTAEELARVESGVPGVLDHAVDIHRPAYKSWHIDVYRRKAREALASANIAETPRQMFAVGSHVGERLWSKAVTDPDSGADFSVPLAEVFHLFAPMAVGRHVGDGSGRDPAARLWGQDFAARAGDTRYILLVRYYRSVAPPQLLYDALADFKQAHVFLWLEDITGVGPG
jgi:hypothetical protein